MKRVLPLAVAALLIASACSDPADDEAARVGETSITLSQVTELLTERDTLSIDEDFREVLFRVVAVEALTQALETDFGAGIDADRVEEVYDGFVADMEAAGLTPADATGLPGASLEMLHFNAAVLVLRDTAAQRLIADPDLLRDLFDAGTEITTVCASHILVGTAEEAESVAARLADGEDFAAVADEVSLDTGSPGGDLGCSSPSRYVEPFAEATMAAPVGEVYGPVETQFGFHLILLSDRTAPTYEELVADPTAYLSPDLGNALWTEWFNGVLRAADIEVNPTYGRWSQEGLGIVAAEDE
ncbi:MAG TPA: peptidylprolyl isomerase [Gemmatimonadales bacterium]|nr:peptidylprolyl isomerase [Gemmatimonadales bacterium]